MIFTVLLTIFLALLILYCFHWYVSIPKNLPPGPLSLPFVGSYLQLKFGSKDRNEITTLEKWSKKFGSIFGFYIGQKFVVVLGNYEMIEKALVKQADVFSGRANTNNITVDRFKKCRNGKWL